MSEDAALEDWEDEFRADAPSPDACAMCGCLVGANAFCEECEAEWREINR